MTAIGWGSTTQGSGATFALQQVTLQRVSYDGTACMQIIPNRSSAFCAGGANGSKGDDALLEERQPARSNLVFFRIIGVCPGDDGDALMMFSASQQWTLVGVISYGFGCLNSGYPSVNTRVTYFLDWIRSLNVTGVVTVGDNNLGMTTTTSVPTTTSLFIRTSTTISAAAMYNDSAVQNSRSTHDQYLSPLALAISMLIILVSMKF